jgi:uncharacterized protein YecE (DUF72 family)
MIVVGTCGFRHRDWARVFYPADLMESGWLDYYSRAFGCCEIGSSARRHPELTLVQHLVDGSDGRLQFIIRAPEVLLRSEPQAGLSGDFLSALWPMAEAGLLGGILAAFDPGFGFNRENFARVCSVRKTLGRAPLIAEFGCPDWRTRKAAGHLASHNISLACVDGTAEPLPDSYPSAAPPGYLRLEGRNRSRWLPGDGSALHDYLYSTAELQAAATRARRLEGECGTVFVVLNNIWRGQAAINGRTLQSLLKEVR